MPTLEALRAAFPHLHMVSDEMLLSPFFHVGVISSYLPEDAHLRLSLQVIGDSLRDIALAEKAAA